MSAHSTPLHYRNLSATYSGTHTSPNSTNSFLQHPHQNGNNTVHGGSASIMNNGYPAPPPPPPVAGATYVTGNYSPSGGFNYPLSGTRTPTGTRMTNAETEYALAAAAAAAARHAAAQMDEDDDEEDEEDDEEGDEDDDDGDTSAYGKKRKAEGQDDKGKTKRSNLDGDGKKQKPARGAKACTNCRRLKMRCVGAENGPPCNRCRNSSHDCIFEVSNRGKKGNKGQRAEAMAQSLKKMEATLATVLKSIRNPGLAAQLGGMATRSPSPIEPAEVQHDQQTGNEAGGKGIFTGFSSNDRLASKTRPAPRAGELEKVTKAWESGGMDEVDRILYESGRGPPPIASGSGGAPAKAKGNEVGVTPGSQGTDPTAPSPADTTGAAASPFTRPQGTRFLEPMPRYGRSAEGGPAPQPTRETVGRYRSGSPRLHALPDNTLNPLGLLAEASLTNSHKVKRAQGRLRSASNSTINTKDGQSPATIASIAAGGSGSAGMKVSGSNGAGAGTGDSTGGAADGEEAEKEAPKLGLANQTYFKPGPMTILPLRQIIIERELPVEILTLGIVSSEEVLDLFKIFFDFCCMHVFLLDPDWHTPELLCSRSPFLFTCVCTVAARFYERRPELHIRCFEFAKKCGFEIMDRGYKSVEIVQGFLLLSMWCQPAERYEQDSAWLFSGVAIRIATDLNLHRKSLASLPGRPQDNDPAVLEREREIINRERTWYICFAVDRSLSGQMGKPYTIREDWLIRNCRHWCLQRLSKPWDVGISALVELHRIMSRQIDFLYSSTASVSGLNVDIDYPTVLQAFNEQLDEWRELWRYRGLFQSQHLISKLGSRSTEPASEGPNPSDDAGATDVPPKADKGSKGETQRKDTVNRMVDDLVGQVPPPDAADHGERTMFFLVRQAPIRFNYAALVINSFGLQHSVDHPMLTGHDKPMYFNRCLTAAKGIVDAAFAMSDIMRFAPDSQFVMIAYACVFLLKLTRPTFQGYADEDTLLAIVSKTVTLLDKIKMNEMHTPALYATFLRTLLLSRLDRTEGSRSGAGTPHRSRAESVSREGGNNEHADAAADQASGLHSSIDPSLVSGNGRGPAVSGGITMMPGGRDDLAINTMQGMNATQMLDAVNTNTDQLLSESFWSSLLPPGFGGPLDGTGGQAADTFNAASIFRNHQRSLMGTPQQTPGITRASTPSMMHSFPNSDFAG